MRIMFVFIFLLLNFLAPQKLHCMIPQPRSSQTLDLAELLPQGLIEDFKNPACVPTKIPTLLEAFSDEEYLKIVDNHGNHCLSMLVLYAHQHKNTNISKNIVAYIVHNIFALDLINNSQLQRTFAQNKHGEDFITVATKLSYQEIVIPVIDHLKTNMPQEAFLSYINADFGLNKKISWHAEYPLFETQKKDTEMLVAYLNELYSETISRLSLALEQETLTYASICRNQATPAPMDTYQEKALPDNHDEREQDTDDFKKIKNALTNSKDNSIILNYKPTRDWLIKKDREGNHLLSQLIRYIYSPAITTEELYQRALTFTLRMIQELTQYRELINPDQTTNDGLWMKNNCNEDVVAVAILRGMHKVVTALLDLRKTQDPAGFKTYLETEQKHRILIYKAFYTQTNQKFFIQSGRKMENLKRDQSQLQIVLLNYYVNCDAFFPEWIKRFFPERYPPTLPAAYPVNFNAPQFVPPCYYQPLPCIQVVQGQTQPAEYRPVRHNPYGHKAIPIAYWAFFDLYNQIFYFAKSNSQDLCVRNEQGEFVGTGFKLETTAAGNFSYKNASKNMVIGLTRHENADIHINS